MRCPMSVLRQLSREYRMNLSAETTPPAAVLITIEQWAKLWALSEMSVQRFRKDADFPADTEVRIGSKVVRFRLDRLITFAAILAARHQQQSEPERLKRSRKNRPEPARDAASAWVPPKTETAAAE